jgi:hypothetical protein
MPALDEIRARWSPPTEPLQLGTWAAVEALLGRPLPDDLRKLFDSYGAGSFAAPGGLHADPPLHLHPASHVAREAQEVLDTLDMYEADDLLAGRPVRELRVVPFAVCRGGVGEVWHWALGSDSGTLFLETSEYRLLQFPGTATDVVLDQLLGQGWFEPWVHEPPPALFVPGEYPTNDPPDVEVTS